MVKVYTMELAGRTLRVEIGKVGKQANGCAFMQYGETTVLSTATASDRTVGGLSCCSSSLPRWATASAVASAVAGLSL